MRIRTLAPWSGLAAAALLAAACASTSKIPDRQGFGPQPVLPTPDTPLVPTINVVNAVGWGARETPAAADGLLVTAFARDLDHPRWLLVLPNGDVLVAETNAPERPEEGKGLRGWMFKRSQKKAGGAVPSANRITLLRDTDGDGVADVKKPFLTNLTSPFGMSGSLPLVQPVYASVVRLHYAAMRCPTSTSSKQRNRGARSGCSRSLPTCPPSAPRNC